MELGQVFRTSKNSKQYLLFQITPPDASLEVEGEPWKVIGGGAEKLIPYGTYTYRVSAPGYHTDAGKIVVSDPENAHTVKVNLLPNYGWYKIEDTGDLLTSADIYVDGIYVADGVSTVGPDSKKQISSGTHTIKIVKKNYQLYEQQFIVKDGQTETIKPRLIPNFSNIIMTIPNGGDIYIDGVKVGADTWSGPLEVGEYIVECRKDHHRTTSQPVKITKAGERQTITLPSPIPLLGSLSVESIPRGSNVVVDGVSRGVTPLFITDIIEGTHSVVISKTGYQNYDSTVDVSANKNTTISATLNDICNVDISYSPRNATLSIDGEICGNNGAYSYVGRGGYHLVKLTAGNRFKQIERKVLFGKTPNLNFSLTRINARPSDFYIGGGLTSVGGGLQATVGCHIKKFNIEVSATQGTESSSVFWNYIGENYNEDNSPKVDYTPRSLAIRMGNSFLLGSKLKFTPQLGVRYTEFETSTGDYIGEEVATYIPTCVSGTVGIRAYWGLFRYLGVSITPEYAFPINEGNLYKILSGMLPEVKSCGSGLGVNAALVLCF